MKSCVLAVSLLALLVAQASHAHADDRSAAAVRDQIDRVLAEDIRLERGRRGMALAGTDFDIGGLSVALRVPPRPPPPPPPPGEVVGPIYRPAPQPVISAPVVQAPVVAAPVAAASAAAAEPAKDLPKTCGWFGPCCLRPDPWTCKDPCAPPEPCDTPWSTQLTLGLNAAQGNTDKLDVTFGGVVKYEQYPWIVRWVWLWAYGETDGTASTDAFNSDVRLERRFGTKWSAFASVDFNSDKISGLQHRWIGNLGMGYWVFERVGTYLKLEAGAGWTLEKRRYMAETEAPSGYLGAEYVYEFRNNIDFKSRARFFPNFDEYDLSLFVFEASLAVPLCEGLSLALALRVDHVIEPPAPRDNTDLLLTLGVQANF
ncbi:MAG: DUF481 domain-containing protein [Planctomycetota bacterium]|nr:DUF481 domain-containing protein [Planctomycetota bacterium]